MIWIFGTQEDPQVSGVCKQLTKLKKPFFVFDHIKPLKLSIRLDSKQLVISHDSKEIKKPDIIWTRLKLFSFSASVSEIERERDLYRQEWRDFYHSMISMLTCKVVNEDVPASTLTKLSQALSAAECGLKTPETLFTTSLTDAKSFFADNLQSIIHKKPSAGGVKYKEESVYLSEEEKIKDKNFVGGIVFTTSVTKDELSNANDEDFQFCPVFLQQKISKKFELRIFVVGSKIFPFKINSQDFEHSKTDWRLATKSLDYKLTKIPKDLSRKLLAFLANRNLFYGSFDFIVDEKGSYIFLECNADGQWAWLDSELNGEISKAFADQLVKESDVSAHGAE